MGGDADSREQGIEFGPLAEDLEAEEYPITHDDLLGKYGDRVLELESGSTTVHEVLDPENDREYRDADGVRQAIFSMVGEGAVGREEYSDRGGEAEGVDDEDESM